MRRWTTWLLLGALAALASVAVADAIRGNAETRKVSAPTISVPLIPRNEPAASAMSGDLYYSDRVDCRIRGLRLPDLTERAAPELGSCSFSISPDGRHALPGDVVWSPDGGASARTDGRFVVFKSDISPVVVRVRGRAPAFKPDGTFTYARGNRVVSWRAPCEASRCDRTVARITEGPVCSLAWLTNRRMALITQSSRQMVTIREGRLHVSTGTPGHRLSDLQISPLGTYVSARADRGGGLLVLAADGHPVVMPPFTDPRAITWSPDERWTAVATKKAVFVFRTSTGDARLRRVPIHAYDLAWR
jgi:hypothetical protein